jgi:hypothetical protein
LLATSRLNNPLLRTFRASDIRLCGGRDRECPRRGAKRPEAKPLVERRRVLVNCVHHGRAHSNLLRCADYAHKRVAEQGRADSAALLADIDS